MRARFAGINPRTGERFSIVVVPAGKIERWPTCGRVPVRQEGDEWAEKRGAYFYVKASDLEPILRVCTFLVDNPGARITMGCVSGTNHRPRRQKEPDTMTKTTTARTARLAAAKQYVATREDVGAALLRLETMRSLVIREGINAFNRYYTTNHGLAVGGLATLQNLFDILLGDCTVLDSLTAERRANAVDYALTILALRHQDESVHINPRLLARRNEVMAA